MAAILTQLSVYCTVNTVGIVTMATYQPKYKQNKVSCKYVEMN